MEISGFTFARNATKLYYPIKPSIKSILPIVDEFVIALGKSDEDDHTQNEIESIGSDKIKIIDTEWDSGRHVKNSIYAEQTDIAKSHCKGDWLFYLQCDEVIHEKYLDNISAACEKYFTDREVEGLLFEYKHFWGDYWHYHKAHNWYPREIRIIRNDPNIHSYQDAQSFRYYSEFDPTAPEAYYKKTHSRKLKVARIYSWVYHYGWVRPPRLMTRKTRNADESYRGSEASNRRLETLPRYFDYGPLDRLAKFEGDHPATMKEWIDKFDWEDILQYSGKRNKSRLIHKHEKLKYRILSFLEYKFLGGKQIGGFRNYRIIRTDKNRFSEHSR